MNVFRTTDKEMIARLRSSNIPYKIECGVIHDREGRRRIKVYYDFQFSDKLMEKEMDIISEEIGNAINEEVSRLNNK